MEEMKEIIYEFIKNNSEEYVIAQGIADKFAIKRSVASHYLNRLVDEKKLSKGKTRPIQFWKNKVDEDDPFSQFVGYDGSVKSQIEQCKAAVTYPPNGLPLIIRGNSGVGKSFLANLIYQYAKEKQVIKGNAPFVILNCADYANNSELLSSVLFGYKKGAFTGALEEQAGLLAKADGGFLFLDEIHNLSAENQEKLFLLIDSQKYRKLGENDQWEHAKVRLILATTEDIRQSLLATFRRRIPLAITLPDYNERNALERNKLIFLFFQSEANALETNIVVEELIIKDLVTQIFEGNIGEVKNKIKVLCAQAYNKKTATSTQILIGDYADSASSITFFFGESDNQSPFSLSFKSQLLTFFQNKNFRELVHDLLFYVTEIASEVKADSIRGEALQDEFSLYFNLIKSMGSHYLANCGLTLSDAEWETLGLLVLSIYLNESSHYVGTNISLQEEKQDRKYFTLARELLEHSLELEGKDHQSLIISATAAYFKRVLPFESKMNALILMHGNQNASSIAQVANKMIKEYVYVSFDMPIDVNTDKMIQQVSDYVKTIDTSAGLVILVDMGSLERMYDQLKDIVLGDLIILSNVSTALAIDVGLKLTQQKTIDELVDINLNPFSPTIQYYEGLSPKKNILISCVSGEGIAIKIKEIINHYIDQSQVDVLTMDHYDLSAKLAENDRGIFINTQVVLTTSKLDSAVVPIINIEEIVNGGVSLEVLGDVIASAQVKECTNDIIKLFTLEGASSKLRFLNPEMIINEVEEVINGYERYYKIEFQHFLRINLFLHFSTMIERILTGEAVSEELSPILQDQRQSFADFIKLSDQIAQKILKKYNIAIPESEYALIYHIITQMLKEK